MDKVPIQQLNRPLQQQRRRDPDRFRNIDVTTVSGQHDRQYQQMVADIESLQQRQGWLAGRGAFDKEDLLYLRDKELEQRYQEQHKRTAEAAVFAAARARAELQGEPAGAAKLRQQETVWFPTKAQSAPKLSVVAVKPVKQQQQKQQAHRDAHPVGEPDEKQHPVKRMRVDADSMVQAAVLQTPQPHGGPTPSEKQQGAGSAQHTACTTEAAEPLQTLLGVYGSDSESDAEDGLEHHRTDHHPQQQQPNQQLQQSKLQLPPAELMLQSDFQSTVQQGRSPVSPAVHVVKEGRYKPQDYGSWV